MAVSSRKIAGCSLAVLLPFFLCCCSSENSTDPQPIAEFAAKNVGKVKLSIKGVGTPIVLFEEFHNSRAINIEEAIALVRMHKLFGMDDIGLEGYVDSSESLPLSLGISSKNIEIALENLKQGEISSAEFMRLVYNINIWPIEKRDDYHGTEVSPLVVKKYILAIAMKKILQRQMAGELQKSDLNALEKITDKLKSTPDGDKIKARLEYIQAIIELDPWSRGVDKLLFNDDTSKFPDISLELSIIDEIDKYSIDNISINQEDRKNFSDYRNFISGRFNASTTMANKIIGLSKNIDSNKTRKVVAVIIGAGHTNDMVSKLRDAQRSVAVITPSSMSKDVTNTYIDNDQGRLKYRSLPIGNDDLSRVLRDISAYAGTRNMHAPPVIEQPWFITKSSIYATLDDLTMTAFEGGRQPPNDDGSNRPLVSDSNPINILVALPVDRFRGKRFIILREDTKLLHEEGKPDSLLFHLVLNPDDLDKKKDLWVRTWRSEKNKKSLDDDNLEVDLEEALKEVKEESKPKPDNKVKPVAFLTEDVQASFSVDRDSLVENTREK